MVLEGQIQDALTGCPVAGAEITCAGPGGLVRGLSDAGGYFQLLDVNGGRWQISVHKSPYSEESRRFLLADPNSFLHFSLRMEGLEEEGVTA